MHTTQEARVATFEGRQEIFPVLIEKLAAAGFCWTSFREHPAAVRCEECELVYKERLVNPNIDLRALHRADCRFHAAAGTLQQQTEPGNVLIDISSNSPHQANTVMATPEISAALKELMSMFEGITVSPVTPAPAAAPPVDIRLPSEMPAERSVPDELKTCRRCDTMFSNRDLLFQHIYSNCGKNPERCPHPFPCRICKESFRMKHQLKSHLKATHDVDLWY